MLNKYRNGLLYSILLYFHPCHVPRPILHRLVWYINNHRTRINNSKQDFIFFLPDRLTEQKPACSLSLSLSTSSSVSYCLSASLPILHTQCFRAYYIIRNYCPGVLNRGGRPLEEWEEVRRWHGRRRRSMKKRKMEW